MAQPYKIGIDARSLEGTRTGTGRYLANILQYFGSNPDFVFYLYFKHEIPTDAYFQEQSYKLRRLGMPMGLESNAVFTHKLLPKALKDDGIDLFFAPSYIAPWNVPVPTVLTLHDISYEAYPEWIPAADRFLLRTVSRHAAKKAVHMLTVSEFSKKEIMRHYGAVSEKISVTPLAADPAIGQIVAEPEEKQILESCGISISSPPAGGGEGGGGSNFILSVGTLINRRYPDVIIEAFAEAGKKFPDLQLVFVGPDRTHPSLDIDDHIRHVEHVLGRSAVRIIPSLGDRELSVLYRKARALVWLSAYEGFGLPPLEAMAIGTPVITSHTSSLPEVVGEGAIRIGDSRGAESSTSGIEVGAGPMVGAVADALTKILIDEQLRVWLVAKGKTQAAKFSWRTTAEQTLGVFRKLLANKASA